MNLSTAIFLVNKAVRPVRVEYDPDNSKNNSPDILFKTLDDSIKIDDFVVVPTRTRVGFTVCKVKEIGFRVNFDTTVQYDWIVARVDLDAHKRLVAQEAIVLNRIGDAEENRKRAELSAALQLSDIDLTDLDVVAAPKLAAPPAPSTT